MEDHRYEVNEAVIQNELVPRKNFNQELISETNRQLGPQKFERIFVGKSL